MIKRIFVFVAFLAGGSFALSGCGDSESHPSKDGAARRPVEIAVATPASERARFEMSGEVVARDRVVLATKAAGRVIRVNVKEGSPVRRGDVLVELDVPELQSAWAQSKATEEAARANAEASERQADRFRRLAASHVVTQRDLELALVSAAGARAVYAQAKSASDMNQRNLEYAVLRAPRDGVIVEKKASPGDLLLPGVPVLILENPSDLEVRATLAAEVAGSIAPGDSAWIVSPRGGSVALSTVVDRVSPNADDHVIVAYFKATGFRARTGTFVNVTLFGPETAEELRLPEGALFYRGPLTGVFAVRDGRAALRWLRVTSDSRVAAGLAPGDSFIVLPPADLQDGDLVESVR